MTVKQTALYQWHVDQGAKMVEFAGYSMPVQYEMGVLKEHLHTRSHAGLFDVSHMGQIIVSGASVASLAVSLESVFPANLVDLAVNKQIYSVLLNAKGGVIDDLMICRRENDFLLVVNAGCKDKDFSYLRGLLDDDIDLELLNNRSLLALQGPESATILTDLGTNVDSMYFMDAAEINIAGVSCWVTRSGYTGEDGFEISVANDDAKVLADALITHDGVAAIGLGARDSLRLEAGLCLYGHELNEEISLVEASLSWAISKSRRVNEVREGGFIASDILFLQQQEGCSRQRVALLAEGKAPVREGAKLFNSADEEIGEVVSGGFGPSIKKPIAMAYINIGEASIGDTVFAAVRKKKLPLRIEKTPFVANNYRRR